MAVLPVAVTGGAFQAKIASGAITASAYIDIQGCFTSDYKFYKLFVGGYSVNSAYLEIGFLDSSNAHIAASNIYYSQYEQYFAHSFYTTSMAAQNTKEPFKSLKKTSGSWFFTKEYEGKLLNSDKIS